MIIFIMRTHALDENGADARDTLTGMRRVALRNALAAYALVGWLCCLVTVVIGDAILIALCALFAVLATVGWLRVWRADKDEFAPK
jgi:hypothetical protein